MLNQIQKTYIVLSAITLSLIFSPALCAGSMSMVTYYPAPQGVYDRIAFIPHTLSNPCTIGSISADQSTGKLAYCQDVSGVGTWGPFNSAWSQTNNDIYSPDSITSTNVKIGLGTASPLARLSLDNDGGILATGTFGSGQTLPDFTMPSGGAIAYRFIWYPRRAIFRALELSASPTATDDSSMGDYSVAFGKDNTPTQIGSIIASGHNNQLNGDYAVLAGGINKTVTGDKAVNLVNIVNNVNYTNFTGNYSTLTTAWSALFNDYQTMGGGWCNDLVGIYATNIAGNQINTCNSPGNYISAQYSVIGGGRNIHNRAHYSTIAGGRNNWTGDGTVGHGSYATVGGCSDNVSSGDHATIAGGFSIGVYGAYGSASGGEGTGFALIGDYVSLTGGYLQAAAATSSYATIIGGARGAVSGQSSVIAGGRTITLSGHYSVTTGTNNTVAADYSWVGGNNMNINNSALRSFVWGYAAASTPFTQPDSFIINSGKVYIGNNTAPSAVLNITSTSTDDYLAVTSSNGASAGDVFVVKGHNGAIDGYIGIGNNNPQYPLEFGAIANNAHLTNGGVWTTPSSRKLKENIQPLETQEAIKTALELNPVKYNYKASKNRHDVGYIAEDVPDLVAAEGRKSIDPMNVTAVLTTVVKDQKKQILDQKEILNNLEEELKNIKSDIASTSHKRTR